MEKDPACAGILSKGWVFLPGQDKIPSKSANSDIAGIGVAIGFSAAAYIAFLLVVCYYLCGYVGDPFVNKLDQGIIDFVWRWTRKRPARTWEPFLRKAILVYSDTQLITGIALLGAMFPQLTTDLPSYYWQIAVYLAWFSSSTHLTTITILRQFFRDHPPIRFWRVLLMVLMAVILGVALLPTGDRYWIVDNQGHFLGGVPAICHFYRMLTPGDFSVRYNQGFTMMVSFLILVFGYTTRILKLHATATNYFHNLLRIRPGRWLKGMLDTAHQRRLAQGASIWLSTQYILLEICLILGRATFDAWESMLWEIIWLLSALVWGSLHLFLARSQNLWKIRWQTAVYESVAVREDDNDWTYAQVFEVIILFLPILHTGEAFFEHKREVKLGLHRHHQLMDDPELETSDSDSSIASDTNDEERGPRRISPQHSKEEPAVQSFSLPQSQPPSPPGTIPASHQQDYYKRWGFRCLVALIICLSLGIILFAIGLSILYDANWAWIGVSAGIAFAIGIALLWTTSMVVWGHNRNILAKKMRMFGDSGQRKFDVFETIIAGLSFCFMVTAQGLFMASFGPWPTGELE